MSKDDSTRAKALQVYEKLLEAWNSRSAVDFAALFGASGSTVGFDGSPMNGRSEIESSLRAIFEGHPTASYVATVREVRSLGSTVTLLRAVAGMTPPGKSEIDAEKNVIHSLVIVHEDQESQIALFQNTPAAFHGRPELSENVTKELSDVVRQGVVVDAG